MNNNILKNSKLQDKIQFKLKTLWITLHAFIFLLAGILFLAGTRFKINTNLFDILPKSNASREVSKADSVFNGKSGRTFIILSKAKNFKNAKENASKLYSILNSTENKKYFENLSLFMGDDLVNEISNYYFKNRYYLLDEKTSESLYTKDGFDDFLTEVQLNLFSGWVGTENVKDDPFVLGESGMISAATKIMDSGTSMSLTDGVLSTYFEDECYVMIRGVLTQKGASITNKNSGVKKIYESVEFLKAENSENANENEFDFIYSGVPFHSYKSSSSAQKEITIISVVSMVLIILLCFYFFRNILPVVCSVCAICVSALFAFLCVLVVFKEIHILTFVFGTTLIGTCLDYSVHFFVRWKADKTLSSGIEIRKKLFKGLSLSLISTEICYLLLFFAPFALLKQVALFSFAGILSSYLTVICIYPMFKSANKKKNLVCENWFEKISKFEKSKNVKKIRYVVFLIIASFAVVLLIAVNKKIHIENNLKSFYSMKGELLQNEIVANKVLNTGSTGSYFIVKGSSKDVLLENEQNFCKKLDKYIAEKKDFSMTYNSTSKYIPAKSVQKKSYDSIKNLFKEVKNQYIVLGFGVRESENLTNEFLKNYNACAGQFIDIENDVPSFLRDAVSNLWIGQVDGQWFSVVMPMHFGDDEFCKQIAASDENVYFMNKVSDIGKELNVLTKLMLVFILVALVVMVVVLLFFYKVKDVLKIICIPVVTVLMCVGVLTLLGVPLGFFSVTGIVLVFGLSIDYIIYSVENCENLNTIALFLSFVSSALSFGVLAFSSFAPVFMFGVTVFVGLLTAVVCTVLVRG